MKLGAVVLAAGFSRRMRKEKVLLPFGESSALERVLSTLRQSGIEERIVVLRADLPEAIARAGRLGARVVVNPHPEEEMLVSIRLGLAELSSDRDAFFIWPADHPAVSVETVVRLAREAGARRVVLPVYRGRRGHPALIGSELLPEIARIAANQGLRQLWRARPEVLQEVTVEDPGVLLDLDTPEDYERALKQLPTS
ncbi:MAG TPA: nucleotidyltransferase family protein [Thermoanaerobaculia bacterium]|nr:nucleotidyltransferase family protein [Thermoanaerobaculia bacterium]